MKDHPAIKTIGIFGHVGTQNLGDETIIAAVIQNIRLRYPDAEIRAFTFNPEDTRVRHGISAFPIRRIPAPHSNGHKAESKAREASDENRASGGTQSVSVILKRIPLLYPLLKGVQKGLGSCKNCVKELGFLIQGYKNLRGTDLLIVAGSGQLTDHSGGPWAYPYTFFKWSLLARAIGAKLAFLSVGTSWIHSPLSEFFLKFCLSRADYRSYRDESSNEEVRKLGLAGQSSIVPDLAYSFRLPKMVSEPRPLESRRVVGINPIPYMHEKFWHTSDSASYENYVRTQASFVSWLIQNGYAIFLFPTQLRADPPVIEDIKKTVEKDGNALAASFQFFLDAPIGSPQELISAISKMDIVVAARYHGVLLSLLLHKPVLAVSYHQKTNDLMARVGQSECTLDLKDCTLEALIEYFRLVESRSKTIETELGSAVPGCRTEVDAQYEKVFSLLEH
jgi:polysaccharide pyruvyl transferase WcaK-like protein